MIHQKTLDILLAFVLLFFFTACTQSAKTDDDLYDKIIITDDANKTKIKAGDKVTLYYCLKNGDKVIMSSDQAIEPTVIEVPQDSLSKFERPLLWLGLGDSCVAHIAAEDATTELLSYQDEFKKGDQATFIYKVLKIE